MGPRFLSVLLAVAAAVPCTVAFNPPDNDAGTGGDASDRFLVPTVILSGSYAGRLTAPQDSVDAYGIIGHKNELLAFSFAFPPGRHVTAVLRSPDLEAFNLMSGFESSVGEPEGHLLDQTGTWTLEIGVALLDSESEFAYGFNVTVGQPALAETVRKHATWGAFEVRVDEPESLFVEARFVAPNREGFPMKPFAATLATDFVARTPDTVLALVRFMSVGANGLGETIRVDGSPLPATTLPVDVKANPEKGGASFRLFLPSMTGHVRFAISSTDPETIIEFRVASSAPVPWAAAFGKDGVHEWTTENAEAEHISAPGFSSTGARSYSFEAGPRFVGWLHAHDAHANATGPDGVTYEPLAAPPRDLIPFYHPIPGPWTLRLGPTTAVGTDANIVYFTGVELPDLGIAPESPVSYLPFRSNIEP